MIRPDPPGRPRLQVLRTRTIRMASRHGGHLWQSGANYVRQFLGFGLSMILARLLLPKAFGEYAYAAAVAHLIMLPTLWNFGMVLLSDHGKTPGLFQELTGLAWLISLLRFTILAAVCAGMVFTAGPRMAILCFLAGLPLVPGELTSILKCDLEGHGLFRPTFIATSVELATSIILGLALAMSLGNAYALAIPGLFVWTTQHAIYRFNSSRRIPFSISLTGIRRHFKTGLWLWLIGAAQDGFARIDKTFGGLFFSSTTLGLYVRAFNFAPLSHLLLNSFLANPSVSALARRNAWEEQRRYLHKVAAIVLSGGILNIIFWQLFADPAIRLLFGPAWLPAAPLFRSFSSLSLCYAIYYLPTVLFLAYKKYNVIAIGNVIGCLTLLVFLLSSGGRLTPLRLSVFFQLSILVKAVFLYSRLIAAKFIAHHDPT